MKSDDEDDMPPLEYVGAIAPLEVPLREGDRVTLKGLSKKELNGQKGTLQSFDQAKQGRLAVKLDSGQHVSIKPENLCKLDSASNGSFVDVRQEAADSDMPPLEYVGGTAVNGVSSKRQSPEGPLEYVGGTAVNGVSSKRQSPEGTTMQNGRQEVDDEDDMPPLEYVGNTPAASSRSPALKPEEEDDMPPLEYVGASAPLEVPSSRSPALKPEEEDDMPPLEYVGASAPLEVPLREGDRVTLKGLSKKDLNGQTGILQSFEQSKQGRLAVKLDSGQRVSVKPENLCKFDSASNGSFVDVRQEAADSDMPPLEYVGGTAVNGVSSKCQSPEGTTMQNGRQEADDEADMPPLEYVGNAPAASSRSPALKPEEEDDMPPLEYVGASAPLEVPLREGDRVTLKGLSKKELNGQKGILQSFEQSKQGRLAVKLDSGERLSIKPENLCKFDSASNGSFVDVRQEAADSDMPPLEYVGSASPGRGSAIPVAHREQEEVDDMPPLEYVGQDSSAGLSLLEGDRVRLKGLSKAGLDGQTGKLQSFDRATKGRLPVKLDSGQLLAVKPDNLEKMASESRNGPVTTCQSVSRKDTGESTFSKGRKTVVSNGKSADGTTSCPDVVGQDEDLPPLEPADGSVSTCTVQTVGTAEQVGSSRHVRSAGAMPPLQTLGQVDVSGQQHRHEVHEPPVSLPAENAGCRELDQKEELQVLRREVQDLRSSHIPSLFQQCMKAMQDELTAVRGEVKRLGKTLEAVQATRAPVRENSEKTEVLALKAQVSDLQEQVRIMKETLDTNGVKKLP
eukprot:s2789_g9.t1